MGVDGWENYKFSEIVEIIGGGTPKTSMEEYWNGDIPWLSVKDFNNDFRTVFQSEKTITKKGLKNSSAKLLDKGDIVISARGTVGELTQLGRPMSFNQSCYGLKAKKVTTNNFVYYLLKHRIKDLQKKTHGSVFDTITRNTFNMLDVALPPLREQKQIAAILSVLDDKIELNHRINQTLESMAQTLFRSWFVDFEPFRDGEFVESELGLIPKGWGVEKLGQVVAVNESSINKSYPYEEIKYIDISSVKSGFLEKTSMHKLEEAPSRAKRLVKHGDTIWSTVRPNRKSYLYIYEPEENLVVSTGFVVLSPKKIPSTYLYEFVTTDSFVNYLSYSAEGSAYPAVRPDRFKKADIIMPPKEVLARFEALVVPIFKCIMENQKQSQTLQSLRDTLLPKLMSGEIRVPIEEEASNERADGTEAG